MAFNSGNSSASSADINVTPLIDVLLVLLIIFMVIVPVIPRGLAALVPQPSIDRGATAPEPPIVVQVHAAPEGNLAYEVNRHRVAKTALLGELASILAGRQDRTIFVRADPELEFATVAEVIGVGRQANADRIGILTQKD